MGFYSVALEKQVSILTKGSIISLSNWQDECVITLQNMGQGSYEHNLHCGIGELGTTVAVTIRPKC
jgi:hypothetical protein